eukprot:86247-Alexandrium_andersonii.AAC.1
MSIIACAGAKRRPAFCPTLVSRASARGDAELRRCPAHHAEPLLRGMASRRHRVCADRRAPAPHHAR